MKKKEEVATLIPETELSLTKEAILKEFQNGNAIKFMEMVRLKLSTVKKPQNLIAEFEGKKIGEIRDIYKIIDLRLMANKLFDEREAERKVLSKLIGTPIPVKEGNNKEEVLQALENQASIIMHEQYVAGLEEALELAKNFITEEEQKRINQENALERLAKLIL